MDIQIIEKGQVFELDVASKAKEGYYFGAGWDVDSDKAVDLDIVCALLTGAKLTKKENLVYFGNRFQPGVKLSKDNTTGEGDGDDESIVIDTRELDPSVDSIVLGLASYSGADLSSAKNTHYRVCDGATEQSEQIADVPVRSDAKSGDTVLVAFKLAKGSNGWTLENVGDFHACGSGTNAISGFGKLFQ